MQHSILYSIITAVSVKSVLSNLEGGLTVLIFIMSKGNIFIMLQVLETLINFKSYLLLMSFMT